MAWEAHIPAMPPEEAAQVAVDMRKRSRSGACSAAFRTCHADARPQGHAARIMMDRYCPRRPHGTSHPDHVADAAANDSLDQGQHAVVAGRGPVSGGDRIVDKGSSIRFWSEIGSARPGTCITVIILC